MSLESKHLSVESPDRGVDFPRPGTQNLKPHFSGWTMLGIGAFTLFLSASAQTYGFSVFIDPMLAEFGWSRSLISSTYTIATLFSAGVVFMGGNLIDRFGHRRVMAITAVLYAIALLVMGSVINPFTLLLGFTLLRSTGSSVLTLTGRTLVSQWFVRRRGRAVSIINLGKMAGMGIVPAVNAVLVTQFGWRDAWRVNALIVATLVPLAILFVHSRPEDVGQFPDGIRPDPPTRATGTPSSAETESWTVRQAMRTRTMWLLLSASVVPAMLTNGISFHQISMLTEQGLSSTSAATTFAIESIVAVPMTLLAGWFADRFGPRLALALGQILLATAMVWLTIVDSTGTAIVFGVLKGLTTGTWILASEVAWPAYFGRRHLGSLLGMSFGVSFIGVAIGPLPFGLIYDATGSYDPAIWGLVVLPVLTTWAALTARSPGTITSRT
jgi:MFS family permease